MGSIHERLPTARRSGALVWGMRDPVFQPVFLEQWLRALPGRAR